VESKKLKRNYLVTIFLVILTLSTFMVFTPSVKSADVKITTIIPTSHYSKVGENVTIIGTINKTDGEYRIWFESQIVKEGNAAGNNLTVTFSVPPKPKGNYTITLQDVTQNINATTWLYIQPKYFISAKVPTSPKQLQEGDAVDIILNVTGGEKDTSYTANVSVTLPSPRNETYWKHITLSNTMSTGNGSTILVYPDNFTGTPPPNTNFTGTYSIAFNKTLATNTFFIGLTNSTEYHRFQSVNIKAKGYKPNENVTVEITFNKKSINKTSWVVTDGHLNMNWGVPKNASIGVYTVNITSTWQTNATKKIPPDVQNFTVPGFAVNMTVKNLADEPVKGVTVKFFENGKSVENGTSAENGLVYPKVGNLKLEIGNYTCDAIFKNETVGKRWVNVTGETVLPFVCNLTNLKITVVDEDNFGIPEVKILLHKNYKTPENQTLTTDINGTAAASSLLPDATYILNASRYDALFNTTTIQGLMKNGSLVAWFNVTVICPSLTLQVNVLDGANKPISNAIVKMQEAIGGRFYEGNTTAEGTVTFRRTFGKYKLEAYDIDAIKLNETYVSLFQNQNITIYCFLYGLNIYVKVVDYIGQPFSNLNVTLQREGLKPRFNQTQSDGIATFNHVTGGNVWVAVYLSGVAEPYISKKVFVDKSTTIEVKVEKFILLAGFPVETSHLITAVIIIAILLVILLIEIYKLKFKKRQKASVTETK